MGLDSVFLGREQEWHWKANPSREWLLRRGKPCPPDKQLWKWMKRAAWRMDSESVGNKVTAVLWLHIPRPN